MKFLCDQCKAKYQIADEKVQGKTLRMKCRKCGHVIEIRATTEAAQTGETMQVASLSDDAAQAALRPSIPAPAPAPAAPRPGAAAPRPAAGGAPRPAAGGAPRPGATSAGAKPGVPKPEPKAPAGGALASAFNKQVSGHAIADAPVSTTPTGPEVPAEEWYVAIDDVPVGPIRLTELRAKYAQGAVTDDSLVWREGYEEWRPLRTLHELHTVVREEVSGAQVPPRGSSLLPNSAASRNAPRTNAPMSGSPRPSTRPAAPVATPRAGGGGGAGNVIPFVQARGAVAARKLDEEPMDDEATQMFAAPMVPPPKPAEPAPISGSLAKGKDDPFGFGVLPEAPPAVAAAAAAPPAPAPVVAAPITEEPTRRKGGLSSGTVALIAAACILLGVVVAVFAVKPKVVERVVEKQVNVPVSVYVPVASDSTPAPTVAAAAPEPSTTAGPKVAAKSPGTAAATTAAPTTTVTNKKLGSLDGPEGPAVGGTGGGGGGGGGALEGKAVESVIASKRVGVRKVCFEPWADKGGASVKITLKIGPDGRVQSSDIANTSGEPAIGQCVQRLSKGWTFPASESGGTFNVPFLFGT